MDDNLTTMAAADISDSEGEVWIRLDLKSVKHISKIVVYSRYFLDYAGTKYPCEQDEER